MTLGLVTEYNPFHNGHLLHLKKSKEITSADNIVVVMSGNFVQRGEPAICDKYIRTKMALLNGADLVIELPIIYATASAEYFALNAVRLLDKSGIVDEMCFGSEAGDLEQISKIVSILDNESDEFKLVLKKNLKKGISYPLARKNALGNLLNEDMEMIKESNNILGVEYVKALRKINSKIIPRTIKREVASYNSKIISDEISSATAIRSELQKNNLDLIKKAMPEKSFELLDKEVIKKFSPVNYDDFSLLFQYILKTKSKEYLSNICDVNEGLENRILTAAQNNFLISDIVKEVKTKRYTFTKIQRAILHILLDIKKCDFEKFNLYGGVQYIRVLGFKKEKSFLLKELSEKAKIPVVLNIKNAEKNIDRLSFEMLKKEIETTDIYYIGQQSKCNFGLEKNIEYRKSLVIV